MKSKSTPNTLRGIAYGASLAAAIVVCLSGSASAADWNGSVDTNWNTFANWSGGVGVGGQNAVINTSTGNVCTITADFVATPIDIIVGTGGGNNGLLNHPSGTGITGSGNWMFVGTNGGTGKYNLADVTTPGTGITGFATGAGSMNARGRLYVGGWTGGGSGVANINTSGTLAIAGQLQVGTNAGTGVFNLEKGTVTTGGGWVEFGNGAGTNGTFNMTGGSFTKTGADHFMIASNGGTAVGNISGGTINVNNEIWVGQAGGSKGTLNLSGTAAITNGSWVAIGRAGGNGTVNMTGGSWTKNGGGNFIVGDNSVGLMNQSAGPVGINGELWVGQAGSGRGTYNLSGGSITVNNWVAIGRDGGTGNFTMTGGSITKNGGGNFIVGASGPGTMVMSAGLVDVATNITWIGETNNCTGTLTLSDTAEFRSSRVVLAPNGGTTGNLNLNGGVLKTSQITGGNGIENVSFNGAQIIATDFNENFISALDNATIDAGGLKIDSGAFNLSSPQVFAGAGGIVKTGAGKLTLSGTSSYTGPHTVSGGTLVVNSLSTATGAFTVADGAGIGVIQGDLDDVFSTAGLTMGSSGATSLSIDLGNYAGITLSAPLNVTGTLTLNGPVTVNVSDALPQVGEVPLISYVGPKGGSGSFVLGELPNGVQGTLVDDGTGLVKLVVTSTALPYWVGTVDGKWDTTTPNWVDEVTLLPSVYGLTDPALFDDRVDVGVTDLVLDTVVSPGGSGVTFDNSLVSYTLNGTGSISGSKGLTKKNTGTVTIGTVNNFTGATVVSGGVLSFASLASGGVASAIGASPAAPENLVLNGGALSYTGPTVSIDRGFTIAGVGSVIQTTNDVTMSGPVASTGGNLTKTGPGMLTLTHTGANVFGKVNQGLKVNGGTLVLDGSSTQTNTVAGEVWIGSTPDAGGNLLLNNTTLNVASWIALGRGNGETGLVSSLIASNSVINNANFSTGYIGETQVGNLSSQVVTMTNTTWTNNGIFLSAESIGSTSDITFAGTSVYTSTGRMNLALGTNSVVNFMIKDTASVTVGGGWFSIGNSGNGLCTMTVKDNGVLNVANIDFNVGDVGTSQGILNIEGSGSVTANGIAFIGKNTGTSGTLNITGGTFTGKRWIPIGRFGGGIGVVNVTGGTFAQQNVNESIIVGEEGTGTLNVSGTGAVVSDSTVYGLIVTNGGTGVGTVNLDGGSITANQVQDRGGLSAFNFNGGTLRAGAESQDAFMYSLDSATVKAGGAVIDTNTRSISIGQSLLDGGDGGGLTKIGQGILRLDGFNTYTGTTKVSAGVLGGSGVVAGPLVVEAGASIAPGASVGTFGAGATTIAGTYACEINGTAADKLVVNGTIDVSAASLVVTELSAATEPVYIIATYTGATPAPFASVTAPAGYTVDYAYNNGTTSTNIALVKSGGAYESWAKANITDINPQADATPGGDPDGDGRNNLGEFALNSNPLSAAVSGKVVGKVATVGGSPALVLSLPVRTGAVFSGTSEQVSAVVDGIIYRIQGSDQLTSWNLVVSEVVGADKEAIETGLPALGAGWTYRTFQAPGPISGDPADYLRAVVEKP